MNDTNFLAISTRDLHKRFANGAGVEALRGVDFQARFAELTFIVGPSGCGKTTLLSVITGLLDPHGRQRFPVASNNASLRSKPAIPCSASMAVNGAPTLARARPICAWLEVRSKSTQRSWTM
jgi:ABC-type glutathione transport system ATPase component